MLKKIGYKNFKNVIIYCMRLGFKNYKSSLDFDLFSYPD